MIPNLPEESGQADLKIVRDTIGNIYLQGFGGREYHKLRPDDLVPFDFRVDMLSIRFGQGLQAIGWATVDFKHVGWSNFELPWFRSFQLRLGLSVKWPLYKYIVKKVHMNISVNP